MSRFLLDIEANGLLMDATVVWCIVLRDIDNGTVHTFGPDDIPAAITKIKQAKELIGHNLSLYDLPLLQRLHKLDWEDFLVTDTMLWSRLLQPDRLGGHSLGAWGERLGYAKGDFTDFSEYTEEMLQYCVQDVEVTSHLYSRLLGQVKNYSNALAIEHKFAYIISQQVLNGFKLDIGFANELLNKLETEYDGLYTRLTDELPQKRIETHFKGVKKGGRFMGLTESGYQYITEKTEVIKEAKWKYIDPNPRSRAQIIEFFQQKYSWQPDQKTEKGTPIINETVLEAMDYPEAQSFSRLFRLSKQIAMIASKNGWTTQLHGERVHGSVITNGAVTGRATHSKPNMAQIDSDERMRACWIPKEGWDLVSCDADQLEVRALAHFTHPYDQGDLKLVILEGDLHSQNQEYCGFKDRKTAKTALYAFIYGAGNIKLGTIEASESPNESYKVYSLIAKGKEVRSNLNNSMHGLIQLSKILNLTLGERNYLFGLDGRPLYIRSQHAALNTLLQSAGAVTMKMCLIEFWRLAKENNYVHGLDYGLVANVHDEIVFEAHKDKAEAIGKLVNDAMQVVVEKLDFKCPLTMGCSIGADWSQIH